MNVKYTGSLSCTTLLYPFHYDDASQTAQLNPHGISTCTACAFHEEELQMNFLVRASAMVSGLEPSFKQPTMSYLALKRSTQLPKASRSATESSATVCLCHSFSSVSIRARPTLASLQKTTDAQCQGILVPRRQGSHSTVKVDARGLLNLRTVQQKHRRGRQGRRRLVQTRGWTY